MFLRSDRRSMWIVIAAAVFYMRLNEESKQLVVHTTPSNHRTIEQMLSLVN